MHAHENVPGSLRSLLPRSLESCVNRIGSDYRVSVDCLHNPVCMVHEISTSVVRSGCMFWFLQGLETLPRLRYVDNLV